MTGQVINQKTKEAISARIVIKAKGNPSDTISIDFDPYSGDYSFMWPAKKPFSIQIKKAGFFSKAENFDFSTSSNFQAINRNFFLQTVEKNKAYTFSNVSFDQGKADLKPGFEAEADKVVAIMAENTQYTLLLEGHTDNQGDWNDNLKLSLERVENVKSYLISKGVDVNRIQTKGWGGTKPLANNLLEDTRKSNRRVEFTLITIE
jgi:outer membrane protein OmpA-like peptidoglycan-associated protein